MSVGRKRQIQRITALCHGTFKSGEFLTGLVIKLNQRIVSVVQNGRNHSLRSDPEGMYRQLRIYIMLYSAGLHNNYLRRLLLADSHVIFTGCNYGLAHLVCHVPKRSAVSVKRFSSIVTVF